MGLSGEGQVGPRYVSDGGGTELRQERTGSMCVTPCHGNMAEAAQRGRLFSAYTAPAGYTVVASAVSPVGAASASAILSVYNPIAGAGGNVNVVLHRVTLIHVSGTPGAGQYMTLDTAYNQVITATPNNGATAGLMPVNHLAGGNTGVAMAYTATTLTGAGASALYRHLGCVSFATALGATTPDMVFRETLDGEIILPPGGLITIGAAATGTSHVVVAGFTWEEVPI